MNENRERLRRLLLLVPTAARRPGVTVTELARRMGVTPKELLRDLDLLTLVGRPPFSPDDFIDIYVEGEKVHVALDQRFSRPPRLTAAEAAALWASAQMLAPAAKSALGSAQKKLLAAVPPDAQNVFRGLSARVGTESAPMDDLLEPLTRAVRKMREVEFRYLAAGKTKGERRRVRPYAVSLHRGQWYLSGYCCTREDDRLFRVDRISELEVTATAFRSRKGPFPVERTAGAGEAARLLFSRGSAPWVRERFGEDVKVRPDGTLEVAIASATPGWMVPFVLSFGGEAQVLGPPTLRRAVREAAKKALARY